MKIFSTLRSRLWLTYALLILTALGLLTGALTLYLLRNPLLYRETLSRMRAVASLVEEQQGDFLTADFRVVEKELMRADEKFHLRFLLFDEKGNLLADTRAKQSQILPFRFGGVRSGVVLKDSAGKAWLYVISRLDDGSRLVVATPRPSVRVFNLLQDELFPSFWGTAAIALFLSLLLAFFMARWIADPLQKMLAATRATPVKTADIPAQGPQEVRDLVCAFNEMVLRVRNTQQAQRDFVANVSHELKTPLTSIRGFSQALLDGTAETPKARREAAEIISNEAERLHRLALDLLDLARFDSGLSEMNFSAVDLNALLTYSLEKFSLKAQEQGVELILHLAEISSFWGDGDRLSQVFTNLIDNALKHTQQGDTITVRSEKTADGIRICVADTGSGIPPKALPHVFDRFFQADSSRFGEESSGLGLAIVREIVLAHGGKITARNAEKKGAVFSLILPLNSPE